ncbi:MAG: CPBP family intramembrane glutamic endopeptidase [Acidimicrobiales bacterium]
MSASGPYGAMQPGAGEGAPDGVLGNGNRSSGFPPESFPSTTFPSSPSPPSPPYPPPPSFAGRVPVVTSGPDAEGEPQDPLSKRPPFDRKGGGIWFWLAVGGFAGGYVFSALLLMIFAAAAGQEKQLSQLESASVPPWWVTLGGLLGLWIGFMAAVVIASRVRGSGNIVKDFGLRVKFWDVPLGIAIGVGGQFLIDLAYVPFEHIYPSLQKSLSEPANRLTGGFHGADLWVIGILTVAVVPVIEELFFRGLLLQSLVRVSRGAGRVIGPAIGIVITGILFGLAHAEPADLAGLAVFGVILSVLAYKTGRLGCSMFAHAGFNLVAVIAIAVPGRIGLGGL